jgi:hypothetical protein
MHALTYMHTYTTCAFTYTHKCMHTHSLAVLGLGLLAEMFWLHKTERRMILTKSPADSCNPAVPPELHCIEP